MCTAHTAVRRGVGTAAATAIRAYALSIVQLASDTVQTTNQITCTLLIP